MALLAESRAASSAQAAAAAASAPAASASSSPSPPQQHRVAWLIGEASYADGSGLDALPNASKDAEEVGKLLADHCGFQTSIVTDAPKAVLECFSRSLFVQSLKGQSDSVFLLYFAGHGYSWNGQTFLVPIDGTASDPGSWVNLNDLIRPLHDSVGGAEGHMKRTAKSCSAKPAPRCLVLVVLDSSRDLPRKGVGQGCRVAAVTDAKQWHPVNTDLCIFYGCDDGRELADARHGAFTQAFIEALKVPGLSWGEIWQKCRVECNRALRGRQRPWKHDTSTNADKLVLHFAATERMVVENLQWAGVRAEQPQLRVAWVIGQACFDDDAGLGKRPAARRDAEEVGELLADRCGFETSIVNNASKAVLEWISTSLFVQSLKGQSDSVFLLYFSGQGFSCNGQTYLVPGDGSATDPRSCMNLYDLLRPFHDSVGGSPPLMERAATSCGTELAPRRLILVVLDSGREVRKDCHVAAATDAMAMAPRDTEFSMFFACEDNTSARDSEDGRHGLFTHFFIEALQVPGLTWQEVWSRCSLGCTMESLGRQRPWKHNSGTRAAHLVLHPIARNPSAVLQEQVEVDSGVDVAEEMETNMTLKTSPSITRGWEHGGWRSSFFSRWLFQGMFSLAVFYFAWCRVGKIFVAELSTMEVDAQAGVCAGMSFEDTGNLTGEEKEAVPAATATEQHVVKSRGNGQLVTVRDVVATEPEDFFGPTRGLAQWQDFLALAHTPGMPIFFNCIQHSTCAMATCSESLGTHVLTEDEWNDGGSPARAKLRELLEWCTSTSTVMCSVSTAAFVRIPGVLSALMVREKVVATPEIFVPWRVHKAISIAVELCRPVGEVPQAFRGAEGSPVGHSQHAYLENWMMRKRAPVLHDWSNCTFDGTCAMTTCSLSVDYTPFPSSTDDNKVVFWQCVDGTISCSIRTTRCSVVERECETLEMALTSESFAAVRAHDSIWKHTDLSLARMAACEHTSHPPSALVAAE